MAYGFEAKNDNGKVIINDTIENLHFIGKATKTSSSSGHGTISGYSGSNNTRHGMFSLFYGLPGHYWRPILDSQTSPVLMNEFQQQQYQMGIFGSATLTSPEFDQTIFRGIKNLRNHSK